MTSNWTSSLWKKLISIPSRTPRSTIAVLVLMTLLLGYGTTKLTVRNSFAGELPSDDPLNIQIEKVKEHFGERSVVLLGVQSDNIYTPENAQHIINLTEELRDLPYVLSDEVVSLATVHRSTQKDWGLETSTYFEELPTSRSGWAQLQKDVAADANVVDRLISKDGTLAVVAAALDDEFEGGEIYDAAKSLVASYPDLKIHVTGAPILVEDVQRGISADSKKFIKIAILIVFFGFFLCFRKLAGVLLPVLMVVMAIIWTMGTMGYLGLPISVVSNALPVIIIAVASSYGIHFMNAYYDIAGDHEDRLAHVTATLEKIAAPILITGITSSLGSASLLIFKITSLKEFGIIGSIGFLYATLICLTLLPSLCVLIKRSSHIEIKNKGISTLLGRVTSSILRHRLKVAGAYLVLIPLSIFWASKINIGDDYIKFFPKSHDGRQAAETFNDRLSGVRVMDVMIDASAYDGIKEPTFISDVMALQSEIEKFSEVGSVHSYTNIISEIRNNVKDDLSAPITTEEIAQYMMLYEMNASPGQIFNLRDEENQRLKVQMLLQSSNPQSHRVLYDQVRDLADTHLTGGAASISFGGDVVGRISLSKYIVAGKIDNILLALAIVLVTCLLIFRSLKRSLMTLLPIVISLIMVFGMMGWMGIRLGISTSLLTAMIVGIGIDFSIHYLTTYFKNKEQETQSQAILSTSAGTGKAIFYDAISNVMGFMVLSFSGFMPVQHFGWLLALSMLLIFANTIILYPVMVAIRSNQAHTSNLIIQHA